MQYITILLDGSTVRSSYLWWAAYAKLGDVPLGTQWTTRSVKWSDLYAQYADKRISTSAYYNNKL
jgi:hypothetical protein